MSETSLSTAQPPTRKAARVPPPDVHPSGQGSPAGAPPEGPAPSGSLKWGSPGRRGFEQLRSASVARSGPVTVSFLPAVSGQRLLLAFAVPKKAGNAVSRNRLRRRLREAARRTPGLPAGTYLIRVAPGAGAMSFQSLCTHLSRAARGLEKLTKGVQAQDGPRHPQNVPNGPPVPPLYHEE